MLDIGLVPNFTQENPSGQPGKTRWRVLNWLQSTLPEPAWAYEMLEYFLGTNVNQVRKIREVLSWVLLPSEDPAED